MVLEWSIGGLIKGEELPQDSSKYALSLKYFVSVLFRFLSPCKLERNVFTLDEYTIDDLGLDLLLLTLVISVFFFKYECLKILFWLLNLH
jgi:hypothetical protein